MKDLLDIKTKTNDAFSETRCGEYPIGYSYVPYQQFEHPYDREQALKYGTIFPSLNKPLGVYGKEFNGRRNAE